MPIAIKKEGARYTARVTPPHGGGREWSTPKPMGLEELINALQDRGCHQNDIGDSLFEADPEWEFRLSR